MSSVRRAALMVSVALASCERPCEPSWIWGGETAVQIQNLNLWMRPVSFRVGAGDCRDKKPPPPIARVWGPNPLAAPRPATGTVIVDTVVRGDSFEVSVSFEPFEGLNTVEIDYGAGRIAEQAVLFVRPTSLEPLAIIEGGCSGPLRVVDDLIACTSVDFFGDELVIEQQSDGGILRREQTQMWSTPLGELLAHHGELGWWSSTVALADWQPTARVDAGVTGFGAMGSLAAVALDDSTLRVLDAVSLAEIARVEVAPCVDTCRVVVSDSAIVLSDFHRGTQVIAAAGGWHLESSDSARLDGNWGDEFWRCGTEWGRISDGGLQVAQSLFSPGQCWGGGPWPRPSLLAREAFIVMCPRRVADAGYEWRAFEANGTCKGDFITGPFDSNHGIIYRLPPEAPAP